MLSLANIAHYERPWKKGLRAQAIVILAQRNPESRVRKPLTLLSIPRTGNLKADHALADLIIAAGELAEAAQQLVDAGAVDDFGTFTYTPPPRTNDDALQRLCAAIGALR